MSSINNIFILRIIITLIFMLIYNCSYSYQDKIIAYVNDAIITSGEVEKRIKLIEHINSLKIDKNQRFQVMNELIDQKLLAQVANANNISITKNQISYYLNNIISNSQLPILDGLLKSSSFNRNEFINYIESQLLINKLIEYKIQPEIFILNQEIIYNKESISKIIKRLPVTDHSSMVEIYEIVIDKEKNTQRDVKKITHIVYTLLNNGASFQELVKQFLQSEKLTYTGLIRWMKISTLSSNIISTLGNSCNIGRISNPINVNNQVIILYVNDIKNIDYINRQIDDEEVKRVIYYQKLNDSFNDYIRTLRSKSYIKIIETY